MIATGVINKILIGVILIAMMSVSGFAEEVKAIDNSTPSEVGSSAADSLAPSASEAKPVEEENWLSGSAGRPKAEDEVQVLTPENDDDDDSDSQVEAKTQLRWAKLYGIWGNYGVGYSTVGFKRPARNMVFGYDKLFFAALEMGLYARISSLTYTDTVNFENTGYSERRDYEISTLLLGPHIRYRLVGQLGLVAGAGVSVLQSKLKGVSSTAPLPSSLVVGETSTFPMDTGYDLGLYYRYKVGPFRIGSEFGYAINSLKPSSAIGEFYVGLHLEYYVRGIIRETITTPAAGE
jgi:hypothetical protein